MSRLGSEYNGTYFMKNSCDSFFPLSLSLFCFIFLIISCLRWPSRRQQSNYMAVDYPPTKIVRSEWRRAECNYAAKLFGRPSENISIINIVTLINHNSCCCADYNRFPRNVCPRRKKVLWGVQGSLGFEACGGCEESRRRGGRPHHVMRPGPMGTRQTSHHMLHDW